MAEKPRRLKRKQSASRFVCAPKATRLFTSFALCAKHKKFFREKFVLLRDARDFIDIKTTLTKVRVV